jgi:hypothetical protein
VCLYQNVIEPMVHGYVEKATIIAFFTRIFANHPVLGSPERTRFITIWVMTALQTASQKPKNTLASSYALATTARSSPYTWRALGCSSAPTLFGTKSQQFYADSHCSWMALYSVGNRPRKSRPRFNPRRYPNCFFIYLVCLCSSSNFFLYI